nr:hypothetical protein Iba_chr01dCG5960 [Ipomoea batatas]
MAKFKRNQCKHDSESDILDDISVKKFPHRRVTRRRTVSLQAAVDLSQWMDVAAVFAVDDDDEAVMDGSSSQLLGDLNTQELLLYIRR